MHLSNIELNNYRGYGHLSVDLDPHLNVFAGKNGAGKSTILDGIALLLSAYLSGYDGLSLMPIENKDAHIIAYSIDKQLDFQSQFPVELKATAVLQDNQSVTWQRLRKKSSESRPSVDGVKPISEVARKYQERLRAGDTSLVVPVIAYYGTGRLWENRGINDPLDEFASRQNGYTGCMSAHLDTRGLITWFERMTYKELQYRCKIDSFETVRSAIEKCFRSITGYSKIKVQSNLDLHDIEIVYKNGKNMKQSISQLSDGYRGVLCLIADIAHRMAVLNPQLSGDILRETPGIVLIDEVDLHLHPEWQQRILEDLTSIFPKVQFIVSTHAPAVINSVCSENLIILDDGEAFSPSGEIYGKDVNSILVGIMGASERPVAIKEMYTAFYNAIDLGDIPSAEKVLHSISSLIGDNDAELAACRVKLSLYKMRRDVK